MNIRTLQRCLIGGGLFITASYAMAASCYSPTGGVACDEKLEGGGSATKPEQHFVETTCSPLDNCNFDRWETIFTTLGTPSVTGTGNHYSQTSHCNAWYTCLDGNLEAEACRVPGSSDLTSSHWRFNSNGECSGSGS